MSYLGLVLQEYPTRTYTNLDPTSIKNTFYNECCTRIYSSYNYHGIDGVEKTYDDDLFGYSGGSIILKDEQGKLKRVILAKEAKNGKDIVLR